MLEKDLQEEAIRQRQERMKPEMVILLKETAARKIETILYAFEQETGLFVYNIEIQRTAPQGGRTRIGMVKIIADVTE